MANKPLTFILFLFLTIFLVILFNTNASQNNLNKKQEAMTEINRLLLPLSNQNITENDFSTLRSLVKGNDYASGEVNEMATMAKYGEYSHIGHGMGFLYNYLKTGNISVCPGHSLSHYYVFMKHGEYSLAQDNLGEANETFAKWESMNPSNYTEFKTLFNYSFNNVENGNLSISDDDLEALVNGPCYIETP